MFFTICNEVYALDLKRINEYIMYSERNPLKEKEIEDVFEITDTASLVQTKKSTREATMLGNTQIDNLRYDLLKTLFLLISETQTEHDFTVGGKLAFNTLLNEGIITKIVK